LAVDAFLELVSFAGETTVGPGFPFPVVGVIFIGVSPWKYGGSTASDASPSIDSFRRSKSKFCRKFFGGSEYFSVRHRDPAFSRAKRGYDNEQSRGTQMSAEKKDGLNRNDEDDNFWTYPPLPPKHDFMYVLVTLFVTICAFGIAFIWVRAHH